MNIYDLPGPSFLGLYVVVTGFAIVIAYIVSTNIMGKGRVNTPKCAELELDPYEIAVLSGGRRNAFLSAMATLGHQGAITIYATTGVVYQGVPLDSQYPLEQAIQLKLPGGPKKIKDLIASQSIKSILTGIETRLAGYGLMVGSERMNSARGASFLIIMLPALFLALPKIIVGIGKEKPVAFLAVLTVATVIIAFSRFLSKDRPTEAAKSIVERQRDKHAALSSNYITAPATLAGADLALAAALFGAVAATSDPFTQAKTALVGVHGSSSGGCGSSTGCGGGSCGGGGCGGGCGGCGG